MDGHRKSIHQVEFFPNRCIRDWKVGMLRSSEKFQQQQQQLLLRTDATCKQMMVSKKRTKKKVRFCCPIGINHRMTHLKLWKPRSCPGIKEHPSCSFGCYPLPSKPPTTYLTGREMHYPQQQQQLGQRNTNNISQMSHIMDPMYVNRYSYYPMPTTSPPRFFHSMKDPPSVVLSQAETETKIERNNHDDMKSHYATQKDAEQAIRWMKSQGYRGSDILNSYYNVERKFWFVGHNRKKEEIG